MARSAAVGRLACFVVVVAAAAGCGGQTIHLGNRLGDSGACPHAQVAAGEVVWIGDTWVLLPGAQHTRVRDLARDVGAIGLSDDYVIAAVPASNMAAVANQYSTRQAGATKVKVLIADGGTWDTILGGGSAASVADAASAFSQLLATAANDGTVADVIYFLMPELPGIPGVAALRPLVQQSCAQSAVPCHFIDLQSFWAPDYATTDAIPIPTDAGARAIADAIWGVMQQYCIAQ